MTRFHDGHERAGSTGRLALMCNVGAMVAHSGLPGGGGDFFCTPFFVGFKQLFISQLLLTRSNFRLGILKCFF